MPGNFLGYFDGFFLGVNDIGDQGSATTMGASFFNPGPASKHNGHVFLQGVGGVGAVFLGQEEGSGGRTLENDESVEFAIIGQRQPLKAALNKAPYQRASSRNFR